MQDEDPDSLIWFIKSRNGLRQPQPHDKHTLHDMTWHEIDQCALPVVNATLCKIFVSYTYTYTRICVLSAHAKYISFGRQQSKKSESH